MPLQRIDLDTIKLLSRVNLLYTLSLTQTIFNKRVTQGVVPLNSISYYQKRTSLSYDAILQDKPYLIKVAHDSVRPNYRTIKTKRL